MDLMDIPHKFGTPSNQPLKAPVCVLWIKPTAYPQKPPTAFLTALRAIPTNPTGSNSHS